MEWGKLAVINLYNCNKNSIKNKRKIKKFVKQLCQKLDMNKKGPTRIKRFGKDSLKGYSFIQFIETSSITCHFDEIQNRAFIDIFSCKKFDSKEAAIFSKDFFQAEKSEVKEISRE